jgi:transketolase
MTTRVYTDARDALFEELFEFAIKDRSVMLLSGDQGAFSLSKFQKQIPDQFINVGVAEQNMIGVAAGLAMTGHKVVVYGIIPFATIRCLEQIKVDLCTQDLPVSIVGVGAGYTYATDGPTHHAVHDLALMRVMPGMQIWNPSDNTMISSLVPRLLGDPGPKYVRLDKGPFPDLYADGQEDFSKGYAVLREGSDLMIVATGLMVHRALEVAESLIASGIDVGVTDLYRIKPVDQSGLFKKIGESKCVATIEENSIVGGIGTIVAELMAEAGAGIRLRRFGVADAFRWVLGGREPLQSIDGLDADTLIKNLTSWAQDGAKVN